MVDKLMISPIEDIKEYNESEDIGLFPEEMRLISKAYTKYWRENSQKETTKSTHQFMWEQLEEWGHPAWFKRTAALESLSRALNNIRSKYGIRLPN